MAGKAQPVRIGPFTGGLNTYSDSSSVADEDATELINFDVDLDGSLASRPPITPTEITLGRYSCRILGLYTTDTNSYVIYSMHDGGTGEYTSYYDIGAGTHATLTATFKAAAMVQYQNKAWLIAEPGSANPGGNWDGATFTAVPAMAKGTSATVYKERIFVGTGSKDSANPSRVFFSAPANPTSWTGTDFFDVNNGDGQPIVAVYSYAGSIAIFKSRSTFVFAYESSPTKGQVQSISVSVGLENPDCIAEVENTLYVMFDSKLFSISNWNWEQLNVKVPFAYRNVNAGNTWSNFSVSAINNRVIARYYDNLYVFGTKTRAWALWQTATTPHKFFKSTVVDTTSGIQTFFAGNYLTLSAGGTAARLFKFKDAYTALDTEPFSCSVASKVYSMDVPYTYKRLTWWGVDLYSKSNITALVTPVVYGRAAKLSDLAGRTIASLAGKTLANLLDTSLDVTDSADINSANNTRTFIKYIKSLRFRQIQFKLTSAVDGSTGTGPLHIYSGSAFIINKETVNKKIN